MQLKLGQGEVIIKSWDYAKAGNALERDKKECNLTVTNKRIVSTVENKKSLVREEIPVSAVHGLEGNFKHNRSILAKIQLIVGIPLCLLVVGIPMVKSALAKLRACVFNLVITTSGGLGDNLSIGAQAAPSATKRFHFFSKSVNKFKVFVNRDIAREILDEIGSVVLDNK